MKSRYLLLVIIVFHLVLATAFSALNPLGEAPDEADHWAYIVYLAQTRSLPKGPQVTQSKHPPLYHLSAAAVASLAEPANRTLRANPDVDLQPAPGWSPNFFIHTTREDWPWQEDVLAFHLARLLSVLLSTLTVAAVFGLGRAAFPAEPLVALAAAGLLAGIPEFAFIGGAVNNDNAAAFFATVGLWGGLRIYRQGGRIGSAWWSIIALGLGLLSKTSTVGVWPAIGMAVVLGAAHSAQTDSRQGLMRRALSAWPRWVRTGLLLFVPALLIASPWFLRNWQLYQDPLGMALARQTIDVRTTDWNTADTWWLLRGWFVSFWGKFGGAGHIPMPQPLYWMLGALSALALVGLARGGLRQQGISRPESRTPMFLLLLALGGVMLAMWRYSLIALGTDQGRLLYPAIGPLVLLLAGGWLALAPDRTRALVATLIVAASSLLGLYGLMGVLRPAFAPPPTASTVAASSAAATVQFDELTLTGWEMEPAMTLFWRTPAGTEQDFRTVLRVIAEDGTLVWEWRRSPGAGRWSTDHWPSEYSMADTYEIGWPEWAAAGEYTVEVGVQPFDGDLIRPHDAPSDHPYVTLGTVHR